MSSSRVKGLNTSVIGSDTVLTGVDQIKYSMIDEE